MVKKLIQHGNSLALILDKPLLELLGISSETTLQIATDGKNLILSPENKPAQEHDLMPALEKVNKKYGRVLKRLGE